RRRRRQAPPRVLEKGEEVSIERGARAAEPPHRELARGEARQRADAPRQLAPGLPEIDEEEQRRGDRSGGQPARHTSGNAAQSSATVRRVSARAAASSPASRARAIAP